MSEQSRPFSGGAIFFIIFDMKATDTFKIASNLKSLEYNLLRRAIEALGGSHVFNTDDEYGNGPIVPANLDDIGVPADYEIDRIAYE